MGKKAKRSANRRMRALVGIMVFFILLILGVAVTLTLKNTSDLQHILQESIKSQLISISVAARDRIDVDKFEQYNSLEDTKADQGAYGRTITNLRIMAEELGAKYIYALKKIDDRYFFVFDTDMDNTEIFIEYTLSPIHEAAFAGKEVAGVMNVQDQYGTFNTGAVPIWKDGRVIGIVCTDIEDVYLSQSIHTARINTILLVSILLLALIFLFYVLLHLLRRINRIQQELERMAHYDSLSGLPNRQCLLEYLGEITQENRAAPFALLFIDLDNFKAVNDGAGHDAGDELLRHIAAYLGSAEHGHATAFRPAAGRLNIAARIGGDEFIQVIEGVSTKQEAADVAQRLLDGFTSAQIDRYVEKYKVGMSVGVALYPYHTDDFHVLINYADIAMYHAKRAGKNQYRVYEDEMSATAEQ